jgi:hypothetical protein
VVVHLVPWATPPPDLVTSVSRGLAAADAAERGGSCCGGGTGYSAGEATAEGAWSRVKEVQNATVFLEACGKSSCAKMTSERHGWGGAASGILAAWRLPCTRSTATCDPTTSAPGG